jgi:hypothetical protein
MGRVQRVTTLVVAVALAGGAPACSNEAGEVEELQAELAQVTSERNELQARLDADAERHDSTVEVTDAISAILDDPTSYGTEEEVVDLLASYATPDAEMRDDVFGDVDIRAAWRNTLFTEAESELQTAHAWVSSDGSQSSSLWVWHGTNPLGNPFELIGINVDTYDDDGRITDSWVAYPYPDDYVVEALRGEGTPITGMWGSSDDAEPFTFADDDLCEWVSEDQVADFVAAEFPWEGTAAEIDDATAPAESCHWRLTSTAGDVGDVYAGDATLGEEFAGNAYDLDKVDIAEFDQELGVEIGAAVTGHPALSDGVVVYNEGFGQFAFGVPPNDEYLTLAVSPGDDDAWDEDYEARFFGVADRFIRALNWLGES